VGDTAETVVQCKPNKVFGMIGKMSIASLSSADVRAMVTIMCECFQLICELCHLLIFTRKSIKSELLAGAPVGTIALTTPFESSYINLYCGSEILFLLPNL
jgi:hypothetical protein